MKLTRPTEARLYLERERAGPESFELAGGSAVVFSARSPGQATPNEDAVALIPFDATSAVLAVADGVGGHQAGGRAAALAIRSLRDGLAAAARQGGSLRTAILDAIERAQEGVGALGGGAATTLAAVELQGGILRPYHVGDSAVLVVGQRGKLKLQTVAHSPVGFAVEAGLLDARDALHHEERHVVSNVLGAGNMRLEIGSSRRLDPRDTVLVASDGLFDNLHLEELVEAIRSGPIEPAARELAEACRRRMAGAEGRNPSKPDDLSFILFRRSRA